MIILIYQINEVHIHEVDEQFIQRNNLKII